MAMCWHVEYFTQFFHLFVDADDVYDEPSSFSARYEMMGTYQEIVVPVRAPARWLKAFQVEACSCLSFCFQPKERVTQIDYVESNKAKIHFNSAESRFLSSNKWHLLGSLQSDEYWILYYQRDTVDMVH